ncbi:hypothetical protein, partial [Microbacterium sp. K41]
GAAAADAGAQQLVAGATRLSAGVTGAHQYTTGVLAGATTLSDTLRAGVTTSVQTLAHPDTKTALQNAATAAPGRSQQLADSLAGMLAADPTNVQLQQLAQLAAGVDQAVDALAAPAAAAPSLA